MPGALFNTACAVTFFPSGMLRAGFTAASGKAHVRPAEQVLHRQRECEGQQSSPGVPERVETTTPRSNVS